MTPEELDKIDALVKVAVEGHLHIGKGIGGSESVSLLRAPIAADHVTKVIAWGVATEKHARLLAALHNAAPTLVAAARDLAWHEDRHGTRAEQEAEDAALDADLARIDALSDEECKAELAAEGINYDAARKKLDVTIKLCAERADLNREVERLRDLVRHQRGPLHDADLITDAEYAALAGDFGAVARLESYDAARAEAARLRATVDAQTAIIVDLKVEKAGLDVKVERLRTFAPVWSNVDDGYGLYVGTAWIGLIDSRGYGWARIGPYPEICYQPGTLPHSVAEAARAVCARLGIPDVEVTS